MLAMTAGFATALAPTASATDSITYLDGMAKVGDVAAGGGRVFVSGDNQIVVADPRGTLTGAITSLSGASGLAMTPDGSRLYAALSGAKQVAEIDTATLTVIRRVDLAEYSCPSNLSLLGNRLWVGYGCANQRNGGVLGLDLSATTPEPVRIVSNMYDTPLVAAAGSTLVIGETGHNACNLMVYDVSVTPAALRGVIDGFDSGVDNLNDLAITPDGSMVISAANFPKRFDGWDTTSLTRVHAYGEVPAPGDPGTSVAVTISPDGAHVAASRTSGIPLALYDTTTTTQTYKADGAGGELLPGTLAFSGHDVFGVAREFTSAGRLRLWRAEGTTLPASTLALTPPSAGTALKPLTVTGKLTLSDGSASGAQPLVVTRKLPDGTSATVAGVTTAADGTFTMTDTPPVSGVITYDVLWEGSSDFRWSKASTTVTVAQHPLSLTLSGPVTGHTDKQLQISGTLDAGDQAPPQDVLFGVLRTVSNSKGTVTTVVGTLTVDGDGAFGFTDTPTESGEYTYKVYGGGNAVFAYTWAQHNVTVRGKAG
ncbi:hypothetical protein [Nonomuraea sp. NPDC005650]|uniref:YncE family protein n=1 Tax=Nonomuraea sp. NPDC005650 TaxID=3157045 RepID=UPI0033B06D04